MSWQKLSLELQHETEVTDDDMGHQRISDVKTESAETQLHGVSASCYYNVPEVMRKGYSAQSFKVQSHDYLVLLFWTCVAHTGGSVVE